MLNRVCLAAAVAVFAAAPAFAADSCGSTPVAPAIAGAADLSGKTTDDAHKVALDALKTVKIYQAALQPFYNCVETQSNANKTAIAEAQSKSDKAKLAQLQDADVQLQKNYQATLATEKQVVGDYMTLHDAYCKMGDGLAGCPKKK
jgi:hypothetical protein